MFLKITKYSLNIIKPKILNTTILLAPPLQMQDILYIFLKKNPRKFPGKLLLQPSQKPNLRYNVSLPVRDAKMYERANNVCVKNNLSRVKYLQNFMLFCQESE